MLEVLHSDFFITPLMKFGIGHALTPLRILTREFPCLQKLFFKKPLRFGKSLQRKLGTVFYFFMMPEERLLETGVYLSCTISRITLRFKLKASIPYDLADNPTSLQLMGSNHTFPAYHPSFGEVKATGIGRDFRSISNWIICCQGDYSMTTIITQPAHVTDLYAVASNKFSSSRASVTTTLVPVLSTRADRDCHWTDMLDGNSQPYPSMHCFCLYLTGYPQS